MLATDADRFDKGMIFDKVRPLFGNGLANSNGDFYRRQRRLVQPAFHRKHIAGYVHTMARAASDLVESWRPGEVVAVDKRMEDEVERRFHAEIDHVLAGHMATFDDIPRLEYTQRIISEVLRKYPLLILMRRARADVDLGGVHIQPGTEVALSQYALHHDPHRYPDPARFDPDRWLPDRAARLPKGAFIPFGAGLRHCPGYSFAETEIAIVAATVATRWRLVPIAGKPVHPKLTATMRPNQLPMMTTPRHT